MCCSGAAPDGSGAIFTDLGREDGLISSSAAAALLLLLAQQSHVSTLLSMLKMEPPPLAPLRLDLLASASCAAIAAT
jgi:hypothetical protein